MKKQLLMYIMGCPVYVKTKDSAEKKTPVKLAAK